MRTKNFTEIEGKILDVNPPEIKARLKKLGAKRVDDYFFKRYVFDVVPAHKNKWIRLRTDGKKTTLTVKELIDDSTEGTREWEIEISSFDTAVLILKEMGITPRGYQENRRCLYEYKGAEISIDEWPKIPPYIEIEAKTTNQIKKIALELGYDTDSVTGKNTEKIYSQYGIRLKDIENMKF